MIIIIKKIVVIIIKNSIKNNYITKNKVNYKCHTDSSEIPYRCKHMN